MKFNDLFSFHVNDSIYLFIYFIFVLRSTLQNCIHGAAASVMVGGQPSVECSRYSYVPLDTECAGLEITAAA